MEEEEREVNGSPPDGNDALNRITLVVGLLTASTILVSVTIAAYAALALQKLNDFQTGFGQLGVLGAATSVGAYWAGVLFCLAALRRPTTALWLREIGRGITAFFGQSTTAGILALAVIGAPVFADKCLNPGFEVQPSIQRASYHASLNDARLVHARSTERLEHGQVREAAGLAWLATARATDAVLAIHTEYVPSGVASRTSSLNRLAQQDSRAANLAQRYGERLYHLHDACFYGGFCGPEIETLVWETEQYINDAAALGPSRLPTE